MKKIKDFVSNNFIKIDNLLYICHDDSKILNLSKELNIENELTLAKNKNNDFFTFQTIQEINDISIIYFSYIGTIDDAGFLCFYTPTIIQNKTNILAIIEFILKLQPLFDQIIIIDAIIKDVQSKFDCFVSKSKEYIYFEVSNNKLGLN